MTATAQDFTGVAGDKVEVDFTVTDDATGAALNLDPLDVEWALTGRGTTITKTEASGIAITDGPNGKCTVTLDPADTAPLAGSYYHELQVTDGASNPVTVARGVAYFEEDLVA